MIRFVQRFTCVMALGMLAGCGGSDGDSAANASVTGTVTFQGQPLANGTVAFSPADGKGTGADAPVAGGKFEVPKLPTGKMRVIVQGFKGEAGATGEPLFTERTPGATRELDIQPGSQTIDLAVAPKGKK